MLCTFTYIVDVRVMLVWAVVLLMLVVMPFTDQLRAPADDDGMCVVG